MSALTSEQRAVLRKLGGWPIADALLDPQRGCAHLRASSWGGTYANGDHFDCTSRGVVVFGYDQADADDFTKTVRFEVRYSEITAYARALPPSVFAELRAARDHHQAVHVDWWNRTTPPIGKRKEPPTESEWAEHMAAWQPAVARLDTAIEAALSLEALDPVQLDLFTSVAS